MNIKAASQRGATDGQIRLEFHQSAAKWDGERERGDDSSLYCAFSSSLISVFELGLHTGKYADSGKKKKNPREGWWHMGKFLGLILGLFPILIQLWANFCQFNPQVRVVRKINALQSEPP